MGQRDHAGRRAVKTSGNGFLIGEEAVSREALLARASERPETFSPNVLLRPIVQDTIFPTVCYVAGPNELAYLGQLRDVYSHFDVPMPLMYQRATATIVDSATLRFVGRYDLVFVRWEGSIAIARREVRIILAPKGRGHVGVQVVIDTPRSQQDVAQPFLLAGWAATASRARSATRCGRSARPPRSRRRRATRRSSRPARASSRSA